MKLTEKELWNIIEDVLQHSRRVLFYGPPATGKTFAAMRKATKKRNIYSITVTPDMSMAEIRGHYIPKGQEFVWKDGVAITAWREGARLVINEIGDAGEDVLVFLHAILDDPDFAEYCLPTGETVKPHKDFQVVATTNHDPRKLPEPLQDRFPVTIQVLVPNPEAIAALPKDLQKTARASAKQTDSERRITVRLWHEFANLRKLIGPEKAAFAVFGTRANDVLDAIRLEDAP